MRQAGATDSAAGTIRANLGYSVVTGLVVLVFAGLWLFEGYYVLTAWSRHCTTRSRRSTGLRQVRS